MATEPPADRIRLTDDFRGTVAPFWTRAWMPSRPLRFVPDPLNPDRQVLSITLPSLAWVDDAGTIVNPLLAEGQLLGGFAQGYGQALLEALVYDETGQLLTGSLMDYAVPRADDLPVPVLAKTVTPSPRNPLGAKGIGEAGCIGVPPAIVNAVVDALAPFGVRHLDMPLTPEKIWRALRA